MTDSQILNARMWGDQQNRSFLPVSGRMTGEVIWEHSTADAGDPLSLCRVGGHLAVWYNGRIDLRESLSGELTWTTPVSMSSHFEASATGFASVDGAGYYRELDLEGRPGERITLPLMEGEGFLHLLHRVDRQLIYAYQLPSQEVSGPDEEWVAPAFAFASVTAGTEKLAWVFERKGTMLAALVNPGGDGGCLAVQNRLYLLEFPPDGKRPDNEDLEPPAKEITTGELISVSYNHEGDLLVVDKTSGEDGQPDETRLSCLSVRGSKKWLISLADPPPPVQPPASSPDGDVWLAVGNELWRVRNGELVWSVELPAEPGKILFSLLADESVLAAAGTVLLQISPAGEQMGLAALDDPVSCRPIMDEQGRVYVAGPGGIRCLK